MTSVALSLKIRCREIADADIEAIGDLLTRGFPRRRRGYWTEGLRRQRDRAIPPNCPRYGYLLECEGVPVGVLLLLFASRDDQTVRCNLSSWYVEPAFRNYATMLTSMAQRNKSVTYVNVTPAASTWPIIEAQGFRAYCRGLFVAVPLLSPDRSKTRITRVSETTAAVDGVADDELALLREHAHYGCISVVAHTRDKAAPFVLVPLRMRSGRISLPVMQLVYCRDVADVVACAGTIGRLCLKHGKPFIAIDANGPIDGLVGYYTEARGRKYFKGPNPPRLADLAGTELALFGP